MLARRRFLQLAIAFGALAATGFRKPPKPPGKPPRRAVYAPAGVAKGTMTALTIHMEPVGFDEEFGGVSLPSSFVPSFQLGDPGDGVDSDFGNYGLSQVSVADGHATITAHRQTTPSGRAYASASMDTYGNFGQLYGTFEARFRFPNGMGVWPAFFLLPVGSHLPYPEIDVMEAYPGQDTHAIVVTVHYEGQPPNPDDRPTMWSVFDGGADMTLDYHIYKIVWTPSAVAFYLDGVLKFTVTEHIPTVPMYPILRLALGSGAYRVDASTPDTLTMDIDYLRVYGA